MDKKEFVKTLKNIKSIVDDIEGVHLALKKLDPDFGGFHISRVNTALLDMLEKLVEDKSQWISYYVYERNWKFTNKKIITDKSGKNLPLRNYNDLWNLITKKK